MPKKVTTKKPAGGVKFGKLRLNTLHNTRVTFGRVLRVYAKKEIASTFYRDLVYGISKYAELFKAETNEDLARRLDEIERRLNDAESRGKVKNVELYETS